MIPARPNCRIVELLLRCHYENMVAAYGEQFLGEYGGRKTESDEKLVYWPAEDGGEGGGWSSLFSGESQIREYFLFSSIVQEVYLKRILLDSWCKETRKVRYFHLRDFQNPTPPNGKRAGCIHSWRRLRHRQMAGRR